MIRHLKLAVWTLLLAVGLVAGVARAQDAKTFTVRDGAFPWYDRINRWALADVPASLAGVGPLPQQNCTAHTVEVPGGATVLTVGIAQTDVEKLKATYPALTLTGETINVVSPAGVKIAYSIATLANPPAKIEGGPGIKAGLLLLKSDGTPAAAGTNPIAPPTSAAPRPAAPAASAAAPAQAPAAPTSAAPVATGEGKTFMVQDGAFPWFDRVNNWALDGVPASLKGTGPLPQQSCTTRTLEIGAAGRTVTIGVSEKDLARFKTLYPAATETGESIAVKNAQGARLPYQIFVLPNAPAKIGGGLGAGLLLLALGEPGAAARPAAAAAVPPAAPAVVPAKAGTGGFAAAPFTPPASAPPTAAVPVPAAPAAVTPPSAAPPAVAAPAAQAVELPAKASFHVYLLLGQSNMVGRDTGPVATQTTDPHVLALNAAGQWVVAREPMHVGGTGIGPGIPFALAQLKANPGVTIGLMPCAVGGTALARWVKGADLYEKAVTRAKLAATVGTIKGALWHQGESDTGKQESADSYETRLTQMFKDLRTDLSLPDLPIVVGQLGDFLAPARYPFVETVKGAIEHIPVVMANVGYADATGLTDKGDHLHFSATAQAEFATRYAAAMQKLQEPPAPVKPKAPAR